MFEKVYSKTKGTYLNKIVLNKSGNLILSKALAVHCRWVEVSIDKKEKLFGLRFKTEKDMGDFKLMEHGASLYAVGFSGILRTYDIPMGEMIVEYQTDLDNHMTIFSYADLFKLQTKLKEASLKIVATRGKKK